VPQTGSPSHLSAEETSSSTHLSFPQPLPTLRDPTFSAKLKKLSKVFPFTLSYASISFFCVQNVKKEMCVLAVIPVTEKDWDKMVIGSDIPVLVDFWAPWCGPCRMIAPVIDELAKEYAGKISCYKVNTDESPNIASQYGIRSIPTVLFFNKGEKKESIIGAVPKSTLCSTLEKYI
ncbi:Thioredoxin M-type, chloroplastic, partial [Linum perenne]